MKIQPTDIFNLTIKLLCEAILILAFFVVIDLTLGEYDIFIVGFLFRAVWDGALKRIFTKEGLTNEPPKRPREQNRIIQTPPMDRTTSIHNRPRGGG